PAAAVTTAAALAARSVRAAAGVVDDPDVGLPVLAGIPLAVDVNGRQAVGEDIVARLGEGMRVQDSHSATAPGMCSECGIAGPIRAPIRVCTRTQGSNGSPSGRVQCAYRSMGMEG